MPLPQRWKESSLNRFKGLIALLSQCRFRSDGKNLLFQNSFCTNRLSSQCRFRNDGKNHITKVVIGEKTVSMPLPQRWKESKCLIEEDEIIDSCLNAASAAIERIVIESRSSAERIFVSMPRAQRWKESTSLSIYYENNKIPSSFK